MSYGTLYFFTKPDPHRPIEEQYVAEIGNDRTSFVDESDAMLYMFDNGIKTFKKLTKEANTYKDLTKIPTYEFHQIEHRVGYVTYGHEPYVDENDTVKRRRSFVWRFIGFGYPCFAKTKEELKVVVSKLITEHNNAPTKLGYNTYPYYHLCINDSVVIRALHKRRVYPHHHRKYLL